MRLVRGISVQTGPDYVPTISSNGEAPQIQLDIALVVRNGAVYGSWWEGRSKETREVGVVSPQEADEIEFVCTPPR